MLLGEWDKALSDLDLALANSPEHGPGYQLRAEVHLEKQAYDLAMRDVQAAMEADPSNIETLIVRGRVREAIRISQQDAIPE
jgi:tetratricopeptide (TPR) repeat protein